MSRVSKALKQFFLPTSDSRTILRVLPLVVVAFIVVVFFVAANFVWEETNSVSFCGLTCHTMPPQYVTHENSVHSNESCEDCHMGRDRLSVMIGRKITYSWQTGTAMLFNTYEYPIVAKNMVPARDACENCHKPEIFSSDKLVELVHFAEDDANTRSSVFLSVKTGGGTKRQGLGYGIHWHVENLVEFYATDESQQTIPYVKVTRDDGSTVEYVDVEANLDPTTIKPEQLTQMDCITCHNRVAHNIDNPNDLMDSLLSRNLVSTDIPGIKKKGTELLSASYNNQQEAFDAIDGLRGYYEAQYPDFYNKSSDLVLSAVQAIQTAYVQTNFPDQKMNWETHPNNEGHQDSPGCFRCHDGKHLTAQKEAIRLECNLCHSIPVASSPNQLTTSLLLEKGLEPDSHLDTNWITLHRTSFDNSCQGCHTVDDPGGTSNTSFCSNSACHGSSWDYAGFDAPKLREVLGVAQMPATATPAPTSSAAQPTAAAPAGPVTYAQVADLFNSKCGACHGANGMKGLNLTSYTTIMAGASDGPVITPGDPENSKLVKVQEGNHPGKFSPEELDLIKQWIQGGALEK